jgi:hypothetical protein
VRSERANDRRSFHKVGARADDVENVHGSLGLLIADC